MYKASLPADLVCFSHLRWDFVYQRPQHLMTRFANVYRVFYVEESIFKAEGANSLEVKQPDADKNIWIITPHLLAGFTEEEQVNQQVFSFN